jgi:dihydroneopterin aldolase/2-amino-4-hydroxy-6-hydroxymethyldihydropteridine diphosphokinase/dihydropteroate synthase
MTSRAHRDIISITSLSLRSPVLLNDLWQKPNKSQPLFISLSISTDVEEEASTDSLLEGESLNYGTVTKTIEKVVSQLGTTSSPYPIGPTGISLEELAETLAKAIIFTSNAPNVSLQLSRPRALLTAASIAVHITRTRSDYCTQSITPSPKAHEYDLLATSTNPLNDKFVINELRRTIIIGLNACELVDEQEVIVDLEFAIDASMSHVSGIKTGWQGWRSVIKAVESVLFTSLWPVKNSTEVMSFYSIYL